MKLLILILTFCLLSSQAFAFLFGNDEKIEPKNCYYYIEVASEVFFVFRAGCQEIKQVGIIERDRVITLQEDMTENLPKKFDFVKEKRDFIESTWPDLKPIKYKD